MTEFFTHTLSNGIRCIFKRIKSPVAYCAMTINAGSRDEQTREFGMAHFVEHSLFKGTKKRRAYHINSRLEKLGGELNAFTTKEETVVHTTTLKTDLPKAVELMSDIIFNSVFPAKGIEREREVILDEINSYKDIPAERIYDEFEDMLFAGSELGHGILGTKNRVGKFTGNDIISFISRCYNTDQMVFSVAADITEKSFLSIAERFFGSLPTSARGFARTPFVNNVPFERSVGKNTHQAHCIIGAPAYNLYDNRRTALSLMTNILGGPAANSMLNVLLREKHGLTYAVEASYIPYGDTGAAIIYFGTDRDKISKCVELTSNVLTRLKNDRLLDRQLSAARKQFIGQLSISMEGNEGYMLGAGKSYLVYGGVDSRQDIYKKIAGISASEIMDAANEVYANPSCLIYK